MSAPTFTTGGPFAAERIAVQHEHWLGVTMNPQPCKCGAPAVTYGHSAHSEDRPVCAPCSRVLRMLRGITVGTVTR